jgi:hypothetical protein
VLCGGGQRRGRHALVTESLGRDHFGVVEVEWCVDGRNTEWENEDDADAAALMEEAEASLEVVYGRFDAWGRGAQINH